LQKKDQSFILPAWQKQERRRPYQSRNHRLAGDRARSSNCSGLGALVLVLLIPLVMITGVLSDRLSRRNEAVAESIGTNSDSISYSFWVPADGFVERRIISPNPFAGLVVNR
jgi:hypothetical protein